MGFEHVVVERGEPIARLTLARPDRRNALSRDVMREVTEALGLLGDDDVARVVVLGAQGPAFSAGHDLAELVAHRDQHFYDCLFDECVEMMQALHGIPQPVIARVHGVATAAGCQLVAACDLAVASDTARFATPGVGIGLFCSTPMVPLSRSVGRKRALEMLLTGDLIDAATACEWGLVNRVVPDDRLDHEVGVLAGRIVAASPLTVATGKRAFWAQEGLDEAGAYALAAPVMADNAMADDAHEGMTAFLEKRPPTWTGR